MSDRYNNEKNHRRHIQVRCVACEDDDNISKWDVSTAASRRRSWPANRQRSIKQSVHVSSGSSKRSVIRWYQPTVYMTVGREGDAPDMGAVTYERVVS